MKGLKKLILASAITAASTSAFAMQALDDDTMSNTTGQDGLTITLGTDVTIGALRIHDKDGLKGSGVPNGAFGAGYDDYFTGANAASDATDLTVSGSIVIDGPITIQDTVPGVGTTLKIDAASQADGSSPVLHIGVTTSSQTIGLGGVKIGVASGNGLAVLDAAGDPTADPLVKANILSFDAGTTLTTGAGNLNIDLGNQPNGHLIWGDSTLNEDVNGNLIALTSLNVTQSDNGIGISDIRIQAAGAATSVTTSITVDIVAGGLSIGTSTVGGTGMDIAIGDIRLGSTGYTAGPVVNAASIGSVYIDNLRTGANTITISGH